ncbi:MAG: glycosyltransferase [Actinomycetes bacterium]
MSGPLVRAGTLLAVAGAVHAAVNARLLRTPPVDPPPVAEPVSVLLPVRDEAARVARCLEALRAQTGVRDLEVLVLDDGSTDGTADVVRGVVAEDPRVRLLSHDPGMPLPPGWLGKPYACARLAEAASGRVLVFVDADVVLAPHAVAGTVTCLRWCGLDLVSPYPRQDAGSAAERVVQPLLQWSYLTLLALRVAERSSRPSLAAANGQLLAVDAAAYHRAGGHAIVRGEVLDDVALLRAVVRTGGHGAVADGTRLASCRMYGSAAALREGYAKSLWSATRSPVGAASLLGALGLAYVVPPLAALRGSRAGLLGYAAGVAGRVVTGRRTGARVWPDALAHPASVLALGALTADSWVRHRRGTLTWKGRRLPRSR